MPAPEQCLQEHCRSPHPLSRHGSYTRQVIEGIMQLMVLIYRFRCRMCGKTVSSPYSFLVPYRRFTAKLICQGVENYGNEETSYKEQSIELSVFNDIECDNETTQILPQVENDSGSRDGCHPAKSTVFSWVDFVCKRVVQTLQQMEKELVLRGHDLQQLRRESCFLNKNAWKAGGKKYRHQKQKPDQLNKLTYAIATTGPLLESERSTVEKLRAYFLGSAERCLDVLSDVSVVLSTTHTSERRLW
ncbi:MAG: DUF6431 domain-containing protein [Candidatus Obscuribacterales bacterium]|nr:DUF6431 domain-containing protein [Candidatus Obscuribacterales bacterium]